MSAIESYMLSNRPRKHSELWLVRLRSEKVVLVGIERSTTETMIRSSNAESDFGPL